MGLAYLVMLFFTAFASLFWVYSGDRINAREDYKTGTAGLINACHEAGKAEAYNDGSFGTTSLGARDCKPNATTGLRRTSIINNLSVDGVKIVAYRPADLGITDTLFSNQRYLVTYVEPNTRVNDIDFNEVVRQMRVVYSDQISTGIVIAQEAGDPAGNYRKIPNSAGLLVRVPVSVPVGSLAYVSTISSRGWPAGCVPNATGTNCYKGFGPAAFGDAIASCVADGGFLSKPSSSTALSDIQAGGLGMADPHWGYWVDGFDTGNNSQFYHHGTTTPVSFVNAAGNPVALPWAPGEPNNAGGAENCINLYGNRTLNDLNCSTALPYVCQY